MTSCIQSKAQVIRNEALNFLSQNPRLKLEDCQQLASRVHEIAVQLPSSPMKLFFHNFDSVFFYAEVAGTKKLLPITYEEGMYIKQHLNKDGKASWPVFNPETKTYLNPKITVTVIERPSNNFKTGEYLGQVLVWAEKDPNGRHYKILEALVPYAEMLKRACGSVTYNKIAQLFPSYPSL